jgi:hypothetical protein
MAWMNTQIVVGLRRLGHDAYYFETTSAWPFDPVQNTREHNGAYALSYLAHLAERFNFADHWAYRRSYSDKQWFGLPRSRAEELLANADAVLNVAGATRFAEEELKVGHLIYLGTDPVIHELAYASGQPETRQLMEEHHQMVTYGENIGKQDCPIPPLPRLIGRTRQPVLLDYWKTGPPLRDAFTTVCNWRQGGLDLDFHGERYLWSKHHEFLKFINLPVRVRRPVELAMGLVDQSSVRHGVGEPVPAFGLPAEERKLLEANLWKLVDAHSFSTDPWAYRDYIVSSSGEFTVARDLNVRLRSGWFSERSACYLAAGRPVITQDTGFRTILPTGEGLFAFSTLDEIAEAFDAIQSDYEKHSRAARVIAEEYFRAEKVLTKLIQDLGL